MPVPKWAKGMQRLMPGIYAKDGALHFYAPELCTHFGLPPTPENQTKVVELFEKAAADVMPKMKVEHVDDDSPPHP